MDPRLLLVTAITLLYKENQLRDPSCNSAELIRDVTTSIKLPETAVDFDRSREIIQGLRATLLWMCDNHNNIPYDRSTFLQRIRINASDDEPLYCAVEQGTEAPASIEELKQQCLNIKNELYQFLRQMRIRETVKKHSNRIFFKPEEIDWNNIVHEIIEELEPLQNFGDKTVVQGMVEEVDLFDTDAVGRILTQSNEAYNGNTVFKTGFQAINRMFGEVGGLRRGDCFLINALQHNFKSGLCKLFFKHCALYNTPVMLDPTKKPLLVHISAEDELRDNIRWMYINLRENETGQECDSKNIDIEFAQQYIIEKLSATGFHVKFFRMNPSETTFRSIQDLCLQLESEGYEIHGFCLDYLNMINKSGCIAGAQGQDTRDLFRRMRNFFSVRKTLFITPHQLSTDAKMLVRQGMTDKFVQDIAGKGYYDSCRTIDQEIDLEIYIHIVVKNGKSYLTIQRGKHRGLSKETPHAHLYTVLPFDPIGSIPDDIYGRDRSVKAPGAGADGGDDSVWWDPSQAA